MATVRDTILALQQHISGRVVGQSALVERIMVALLADGHILVEGAPGLAKTTAIRTLAEGVEADYHRVQFTPDLLPADIVGTEIYRPQEGSFEFQQGPIFHNLVLADEINRAPAKAQSALLEAMAERQVTVGKTTYDLPPLFMVMATQNPIEQEGTYPLPEAQLDRFLLYVQIGYPDANTERDILRISRNERSAAGLAPPSDKLTQEALFAARGELDAIHLSEAVENYIVQLILATRTPGHYNDDLARWIQFGASPRATIALERCARALAWLAGRDFVSPEDVQAIAPDVLRHRILLNFEAEADGITSNEVIAQLLKLIAVP